MDWKDKRITELESLLKAALEKIAKLEKNSSNSSNPPSSDIVKPPKPKDKERRKRKIGAQQGHNQNLRQPIAPELVDEIGQPILQAVLEQRRGRQELRWQAEKGGRKTMVRQSNFSCNSLFCFTKNACF